MGETMGRSVMGMVGRRVGFTVREGDGLRVSDDVGSNVGCSVGTSEGAVEG